MRYFRMGHAEEDEKRRWVLSHPPSVANRFDFCACDLVEEWNSSVFFTYTEDGPHVDFPRVTGSRHAMSARLQELVAQTAPCHVQFLPFRIRSSVGTGEVNGYALANYLRRIDCLDRERCRTDNDCWEAFNLYGDIPLVETVIKQSRIGDAKVFRVVGDSELVVVRGDLKTAIEKAGMTGLSFDEVALAET